MTTTTTPAASQPAPHLSSEVVVRPLLASDLEAVVALDRRITGTPRRGYFVKRLDAALRRPKAHLQFAATTGQGLVGFLLARVAGGEFGRPEAVVVLETLGVDPTARHHGLGRAMVTALEGLMRSHGIRSLVTQVDWKNEAMLRFLAGAGFTLSSRPVLERAVDRIPLPSTDEEIEKWPPVVRQLRSDDLDAIARIDKKITGQDRSEYLKRKFDEVLKESAIEVSLVAEEKGFPVAFAMARVDSGDFGRVDASAALDTLGVDPAFAHQGYMRAVLSQMIENLAALHVERLETEVARDSFGLLKFLYAFGFSSSQRLSFQRAV